MQSTKDDVMKREGAEKQRELDSITYYEFPEAARFGRKLPKEKIYHYSSPSNAVKKQFVQQIDKMVWQYKLAPETINISPSQTVPEIQVFDLFLKPEQNELTEAVLRTIDKAIAFPIYYRIHKTGANQQQQVQLCMAYKRPNEADSKQWVVSEYFKSEWLETGEVASIKQTMPIVLTLYGLYEQLLRSLINDTAKPNENLKEQVERLSIIKSKQNELAKLQALLHKEVQFNRKVEINQQVNRIQDELQQLKA